MNVHALIFGKLTGVRQHCAQISVPNTIQMKKIVLELGAAIYLRLYVTHGFLGV